MVDRNPERNRNEVISHLIHLAEVTNPTGLPSGNQSSLINNPASVEGLRTGDDFSATIGLLPDLSDSQKGGE